MKKLALALILLFLVACGSGAIEETPEYYIAEVITETTTEAPAEAETEPETEAEAEPPPEPIHIRIQFAGDILLHGGLGAGIGNNQFNYRPFMWAIREHINGDLNLVNMETPVDVFGNNADIRTWPRFNAPFEILDGLIYAGFNHLITANNHSFDMGHSGLLASLDNFERAGISQTGMYRNQEEFNVPTIIDVQGIQVGIIAYADSVNGLESLIPADIRPYTLRRFYSNNLNSIPAMRTDMEAIRAAGADLVILSLHWGLEYENAPRNWQVEVAHALIEAGADIIMGHHSHTPHPLEWHYREDGTRGLIIYSLGNFLSDQIALGTPATQYGMLATAYVQLCHINGVSVYHAHVLPTVFARDPGRILGSPYSILPVINGEVPESVTDAGLRAWGRRAYEHVLWIIGEEFMYRP